MTWPCGALATPLHVLASTLGSERVIFIDFGSVLTFRGGCQYAVVCRREKTLAKSRVEWEKTRTGHGPRWSTTD